MSDVRIVTLDEFVGVEEASAEPLIGVRRETILPAGGRLLMYGDGGAGKTTFTVDAIAHLAAGITWLGIEVARPLTFLIIENEGPRGMFREKLGEKVLDWQGPPFRRHVHVLEEPWAQFVFGDITITDPVMTYIEHHDIDVLVAGPLASLGTIGGGTPAEVEQFVKLLDAMKAGCSRPYAEWLIHHENKAGAISGAWNRVPDTLVHVQGQGNGRTRVHWEKARHSSAWHDTSTNLVWTAGKSFELDVPKIRDLHDELILAFTADARWRTAKESSALVGANVDHVREALAVLVDRGTMKYEEGPPGRSPSAKCWSLKGDSEALSHPESVGLFSHRGDDTDSVTQPKRGSPSLSQSPSRNGSDSDSPSHTESERAAS